MDNIKFLNFDIDENFLSTLVARQNEFSILKRLLSQKQIIQVNGITGIGKTTFVKSFIYTFQHNYNCFLWINKRESLKEALTRNKKLQHILQKEQENNDELLFKGSLQLIEPPNIFVIDDVDEIDYEIVDVIHSLRNWKFIIISRGSLSNYPSIALSFLSQAESFEFFKKLVVKWDVKSIQNQYENIIRLLQFTGNTPLAIELIALIIKERKLDSVDEIEQYIKSLPYISLYFPNKPISIYLDTNDKNEILKVYNEVRKYLSENEVEINEELPAIKGSWFKKIYTRGKDALASPEFQKKLQEVEHAIKLKTIKREQSEIDKNESEAVANIINSTKDIPNIAINIGSILIVKITDLNGIPKIAVKSLSIFEMIAIEKNPELLKTPGDILDNLKIENRNLIEDNKDTLQ